MAGLAGRVALVTGASRGIGRAIAERLSASGCSLVINGRDPSTLKDAAATLGAIAVAGDVSKSDEAKWIVDQTVAAHGRLDILVCNVGSGRSVPPGQENAAEWQRVFAINLFSTTNMVEAARAALATSKGAVVCVSSICGTEVVPHAPVTYSAAKAALNAYIRGIARPLGAEGVRINAVAPGNILFDGSVWQRKLDEDQAAVHAILACEVALGRLGTPEDVAAMVAFLASDAAKFVTGTVVVADGGQVRSAR